MEIAEALKKLGQQDDHEKVPDDLVPAGNIEPLHGILDADKFDRLIDLLKDQGWKGRPILVERVGEDNYQAWTGTHRLSAAQELDEDVPVVILPEDITSEQLGAFTEDHDRVQFLRRRNLTRAADLMQAEIDANELDEALREQTGKPSFSAARIPGYENAPSTKLLATHCVICGRPLRDPESVERGMGPECSGQGYLDDGENKSLANQFIHKAAVELAAGRISDVLALCDGLDTLGFHVAATRIRENHGNADQKVKIEIDVVDGCGSLLVRTPYKRGDKDRFVQAWRDIPGRRYIREEQANEIPRASKPELWALLREFFPGEHGRGPKGLFRIPKK